MKRPTKARIQAAINLLELTAQQFDDKETQRVALLAMAEALTWAAAVGGSRVLMERRFETFLLCLAADWEGNVCDQKDRPVDVLLALATGKER